VNAAQRIAEIQLPDSHGTPVMLGDLWHERPIAIVWLRHYG